MLSDPSKVRATLDRRGSSLHGSQRGGHQEAADNKGVGVLDLPGDLEDSGQASGPTTGPEGELTRGQAGTLGVPEIIARRQTATCEGSRRGH